MVSGVGRRSRAAVRGLLCRKTRRPLVREIRLDSSGAGDHSVWAGSWPGADPELTRSGPGGSRERLLCRRTEIEPRGGARSRAGATAARDVWKTCSVMREGACRD